VCWYSQPLLGCGLACQCVHHKILLMLQLNLCTCNLPLLGLLQSYGIKVGYGAGGPSSQTVKPGEPEQRKASSCC
jgi:hypothetical protein